MAQTVSQPAVYANGLICSYKMTNKMQLSRINLLFSCSLAALHVLSDVIIHHEKHLNCSSFWFYPRVMLSAAFMAE